MSNLKNDMTTIEFFDAYLSSMRALVLFQSGGLRICFFAPLKGTTIAFLRPWYEQAVNDDG